MNPAENPNTLALLERARKLCEPQTWYQVSKRTGIKEATISRCRLHRKTLSNINAYKLAKLVGLDPKDVMAYMEEDRAKDDATREWRVVVCWISYCASSLTGAIDAAFEKEKL